MLRRCLAISLVVPGMLAGAAALGASGPRDRTDRTNRTDEEVASAAPGPSFRIHGNAQFRTTVTNWGYFGNPSSAFVDSATLGTSDTLLAPGFESPARSLIDYLYNAGLWIGGVVNGDTLVSDGATDYPPVYELHPDVEGSPLPYSDILGDEEFRANYTDSITDPGRVKPDDVDGAHRPLPVSVRQTTRLVDDSTYGSGVLIEVVVRNIGATTIDGLWLGWYVDSDIKHPAHPDSWLNDLSGHRAGSVNVDGHLVNVSAAWSADNDGDPDSVSGLFDARSPTGVIAMMYLGGSQSLPLESFNWWIGGFSRGYDWGPSRTPWDSNSFGGYGRPIGDKMKYRRMSNQEIDYDQVYAAVDMSSQGWIKPTTSSVARDFADGYDTRFLHSVGTVDLAPGDSIVAAWALVVAPHFHTDPHHFASTFSYTAPGTYLGGLGFGSLDTTLARMKILWDDRFHDATIGPPQKFAVAGWDDSTAQLRWLPRGTQRLRGYGIFRSFDPGAFPGTPLAILPVGDSVFHDHALQRQPVYYYVIRSLDSLGRYGTSSQVLNVLPDRPMTPVVLSARGGKGKISIVWQAPSEPDVVSHRILRRQGGGLWSTVGQTSSPPPFVDSTVTNAVVYEYEVTATSTLGNESYPSDSIQGLAFAFDGPPLVIDETLSGSTSLTDKDSVASVWQRLVAGLGGTYRDADPVLTAPFGLEVYNPHPVAIVVSDGRFAPRPETQGQLADYVYAGGITILTGRDLFNVNAITEGTITFGPGDWAYDDLGITAAYYPRVLLSHPTRPNAEFSGAHSLDVLLPNLAVDSTRTDWGLNPALPAPGAAVPFVGYFDVDTTRARVIYTYVSRDGSASASQGRPVGVISKVEGVHAAVLGFPLSYMAENQARAAVAGMLAEMGWTRDIPGDLSGDGSVTISDLLMLIHYLFSRGEITNAQNADVNGDCRLDLIDVVTMINYIFRGGPVLKQGCG